MNARYYIYWNLHKKQWSVRYKGKVIAHSGTVSCSRVNFKVGEKGRQRVLLEKRKNVHAYVVADRIDFPDNVNVKPLCMVRYNPYENSTFVTDIGAPIFTAGKVLLLPTGKVVTYYE